MTSVRHFLIALPLIVLIVVMACESGGDDRKVALAEWFVNWSEISPAGSNTYDPLDEEHSDLFASLVALESPWTSGPNMGLLYNFVTAHQLYYQANIPLKDLFTARFYEQATVLLKERLPPDAFDPTEEDYFNCYSGLSIGGVWLAQTHGGRSDPYASVGLLTPEDSLMLELTESLYRSAGVDADRVYNLCATRNLALDNLSHVRSEVQAVLENEIKEAAKPRCLADPSSREFGLLILCQDLRLETAPRIAE